LKTLAGFVDTTPSKATLAGRPGFSFRSVWCPSALGCGGVPDLFVRLAVPWLDRCGCGSRGRLRGFVAVV